jgi:hypothetical protein
MSCSTCAKEVRAAMMMLDAPARANEIAVAAPMPFEAPVMKTVLPLKFV